MLRARRPVARRGSRILRRLWVVVATLLIGLFTSLPVLDAFAQCDESAATGCPDDDRSCQCPAQCACGCVHIAPGDFPAPLPQLSRVRIEHAVDWGPAIQSAPPDPALPGALKVPISLG